MRSGGHRVARGRLASASLSMLFAGSGLAAQATGEVGADPATARRCSTQFHEARLISTSATPIPDAIWERGSSWDAAVRFRLDEGGQPSSIRANVTSDIDGKPALEQFTVQALGGYRFCLPENALPGTAYVGRMHFAHSRLGAIYGNAEMYVQQFVPSYTRAEVAGRHVGTVEVRGTFAPDGRPTSVEVVHSSGDPALDAKSLEAMAQWLLVFRDGSAVTRPVVYTQPYVYRIQ